MARAAEVLAVVAVFLSFLGMLISYVKSIRRPRGVPVPQRVAQLYGHPWPPVLHIRQELPAPGSGYGWETKVVVNGDGDDILFLSLVDVGKGVNVETNEINLTYSRRRVKYYDDTTWTQEYRNFSHDKGHVFNDKLVGPVIDWARSAVNRLHAGETKDYDLS